MKMNLLHRVGALILALALLLSFPLCVSAEDTADEYKVTLSQTALALELTENPVPVALSAVVTKGGEKIENATVTWSNNKAKGENGKVVVKVHTDKGTVTANDLGTAVVTATYTAGDGKIYTATCTVTVIKPPVSVSSVTIKNGSEDAGTSIVCSLNDTLALTATVLPADATNKTVTWTSSNPAVAAVNSDGAVTAVAPGTATITATTADGGKTDTVDITVSGIVMPTKREILVGREEMLTVESYGSVPDRTTWEWSSSNISIAEVSATGKITTYNLGTVTITLKAGGYKVSCAVTVKADVADAVQTSMNSAEVYSFDGLVSKINSKIFSKTGKNLNYVSSMSVPTSQGVLYYGYISPNLIGQGVGNENYYYSASSGQRALSDVTFVPRSGFSGTAEITYAARDSGGGTVNGSILIAVSSASDVAYNTASGTPVTFETEDFSQIWRAKSGHEINYITFTQPAASQGVLYYNYSEMALFNSEVNSGTKYYRTNNPYLEKITFVPAEDYTGVVTIPYSCVTAGGTYFGQVTITVYAAPGSNTGKIQYSVASGGYVELDSYDLNKACAELNNASLKYVYFTQPDASEGTLYYNYAGINDYGGVVSETTRYFASYSSTPRIDNVAFVPARGFNGTVKVPVTGYDSRGDSFTAEMIFKVSGATGSVHYTTSVGLPVEFDGLDFNEACEKATGGSLDWISFELPRAGAGVLYRYYYVYSGIQSGSKLSASTQLTRTQLSEVVFLPNNNFFGTVTIPFNGYDTNGARFSGVVEIFVEASAGDKTVKYSLVSGGVVEFNTSDFNAACRAFTGESLSHVNFTLPSSKYGKLYYQYDARKGTGGMVNAGTNYYLGKSRLLSDVSFAAADGCSGSFTMNYTGWSTGGKRFTGKVEFTVSEPVANVIHYSGSALPIALKADDFKQTCVDTMGRALDYICFTSLPAETQGRLYYNYTSPAAPGTAAATQTKYYISGTPAVEELTFLAKAEYQGRVTFDYIGYDTLGKSYTGTVSITIATGGTTTQFLDMKGYGWAAPSIKYLSESGVVTGYSATRYGPEQAMSRGNFTLMLYRALQLEGDGSAVSYSDVPPTKYYAKAIAVATQLGIVEGTDGKFYPDLPITRQSALNMTYLALQIKGREMPMVSTSVLNAYADGDQVASYAREAMASMVQMGIVKGSTSGKLNPTDAISRAEMAVLLHRILTM